MHRVQAGSGRGRYSVPFFFEPGEGCVVRCADEDGMGDGIVYGEHVRGKMRTWVEWIVGMIVNAWGRRGGDLRIDDRVLGCRDVPHKTCLDA
jgi:hypothetical protein